MNPMPRRYSRTVRAALVVLGLAVHGAALAQSPARPAADQNAASVTRFGAIGDGAANDTAAFQKAAAQGGEVFIPAGKGCYRIDKTVAITKPSRWVGAPGSCITPDLGLSGDAALFVINASDVTFEDVSVVGTGVTFAPATVNHMAFHIGKDWKRHSNLRFRRIRITDFKFSDGKTGLAGRISSHGFFVQGASDISIEDSVFTRISGAAIIVHYTDKISVLRNSVTDAEWYPITMYRAVKDFDIGFNTITTTPASTGVFWGGAIDLVSQTPVCPNTRDVPDRIRNGRIHDNKISGAYGYGVVIRVASSSDIVVERNTIADYDVAAAPSDPSSLSAIVVQNRANFGSTLAQPISATHTGPVALVSAVYPTTFGKPYAAKVGDEWMCVTPTAAKTVNITERGIGGTRAAAHTRGTRIANSNGPNANIVIRDNHVAAPRSPKQRMQGIYVRNEWESETNPLVGVTISGNQLVASKTGVSFTSPILINGFLGGIKAVSINDNVIVADRSRPGALGTGAVSIFGLKESGRVVDVSASGNTLVNKGKRDQTAVGFGFDYVDRVSLGVNTFVAFQSPVRVSPTSSGRVRRGREIIEGAPSRAPQRAPSGASPRPPSGAPSGAPR